MFLYMPLQIARSWTAIITLVASKRFLPTVSQEMPSEDPSLCEFFSQYWQLKDLSPVWIRMCSFKLPFCVYLKLHCVSSDDQLLYICIHTDYNWKVFHQYEWVSVSSGRQLLCIWIHTDYWWKACPPLWMSTCFFRLPASLHLYSHWLQLKGFLPLWMSEWFFRWLARVHLYSHWLQLKGFPPIWMSRCFFRSPACMHLYSHRSQLKGFLPLWIRRCFFKLPLVVHL